MSLSKQIRAYIHEIARIKKSPHSIALGFGIGTFISILPTPGLNIVFGFVILLFVKNANKFALFGAMALFNPLVLAPLYIWSYQIGNFIFGQAPVVEVSVSFFDQLFHFSRRFLVGNFILACVFSITGYFVTRLIAVKYSIAKTHPKSQKL